ncbi:MAG TPA: response regulator, partial [Nitrospira sp.]|nr:response regulator [Nitrospira sp.]
MPKADILIVEDEAVVAADLAGKLQRAGYRSVGIAADGDEAVATAKATAPDLVLMDIRLGGNTDGIETAERIRAFRNIPIVYLTAHSDTDTLRRAS